MPFPTLDPIRLAQNRNRIKQQNIIPSAIRRRQQLVTESVYSAIVTTDGKIGDFTDIQLAIEYVHTLGGGTIFVKSGMYKISSPLIFYNNINLIGEDPQTTFVDLASAGDLTNGGIQMRGIIINGQGLNGTVAVTNGSATVTGTSTLFLSAAPGDYIVINAIPYEILSITSATSLVLVEIYYGVAGSSLAYSIIRAIKNTAITGFTIMNGRMASTAGDGIKVNYALTVSINNCTINNCVDGIDASYVFDFNAFSNQCNTNTAEGINLSLIFGGYITNNYCFNNQGSGIRSRSFADKQPVYILNNTCLANGVNGLYLFLGVFNIVTGNVANNNAGIGILLQGAEKNTISDNVVLSNGDDGIKVTNQVSVDSAGNTICNNQVQFNVDNGIELTTGGVNNIVCNNFNNNNGDDMDNAGAGNIVQNNWNDI